MLLKSSAGAVRLIYACVVLMVAAAATYVIAFVAAASRLQGVDDSGRLLTIAAVGGVVLFAVGVCAVLLALAAGIGRSDEEHASGVAQMQVSIEALQARVDMLCQQLIHVSPVDEDPAPPPPRPAEYAEGLTVAEEPTQDPADAQPPAISDFEDTCSLIEDYMAIGSWDLAIQLAEQLVVYRPGEESAAILDRVRREHAAYCDTNAQRLYAEVKRDVERRQWRSALSTLRRMIEKLPDHPRTRKLRPQLDIIRDNAEIQERQEIETRIQELIRGQRVAEAIELGEDLIERFPLSPQSQTLEELLPKLRALAAEQQVDAIF